MSTRTDHTLPDAGHRAGLPRTTQAAEGLLRHRFTVADLEAMTRAGIFAKEDRIELIGGEIVPMSPKGNQHEVLKAALNLYWAQQLPPQIRFVTETTFRLTPDTYLEPDFVFYDRATGIRGLNGDTAHLVVEVADSSFAYDIGRKAALYASFGIKELWVIHAVRLETRIHRAPSLTGYQSAVDLPADHALIPAFAPELAVTLAALELET
ncbi:MAG: Uma2 family endonuclease [Hyphomicrobiales bacterium]|nr:Uma2 family endonuclease [Hyphomicrobiales bacterium]